LTATIRFLVLGAAAGGGLPQWNCGCRNCNMARDPNSSLKPQSQSSLAVSLDGESWAILNASPDIRQQIERSKPLHPISLRDTPIKSVLITNGDVDHIAGLLTLREKQPFDLWLTPAIGAILDENPIFRALDPQVVKRRMIELDEPFFLLPGLRAKLFSVPGKVPLFMETPDLKIGAETEQTVGVELKAGGNRAYYVPGCASIPEALASRLHGAGLLFFDGTLFTDDEMIVAGVGTKTGRRMGHMPIDGSDVSLLSLDRLKIGRKIYIHINNTNPIWRAGHERERLGERGFEVGFDGMEVTLAASS
jgi:pyrroloquinoline quinone biosynthesis protein B